MSDERKVVAIFVSSDAKEVVHEADFSGKQLPSEVEYGGRRFKYVGAYERSKDTAAEYREVPSIEG